MKLIFVVFFLSCSFLTFSQNKCNITYVANEGFLIESENKKILVDALFDKINENWCDSPSDSIIELMQTAKAPFNNVDIIAISHKHRDHFNDSVVVNHLLSNKKGIVICPNQVFEILKENKNFPQIKNRIVKITPNQYCDTNITVSDIPIRVLRLEHSHYMEIDSASGEQVNRHRNIENIGFLFNLNDTKIFHCGDTNPLNEEEYSTFKLNNDSIDIAFLERQFFSRGEKSIGVLNDYINPKNIILMHINPSNISLFKNYFQSQDNIFIFENKMDSIKL